MDSEPGRSLIVWTIRVSVALYAWSLFTFVKCQRQQRQQSTSVAWAPGPWTHSVHGPGNLVTSRTDIGSPQKLPHADLYVWTASWFLCVVHVIFAFHFEHNWSHQEALKHTAEVTASVTGLNWGIGLYVNYLFLGAWGVDVVRRFQTPAATTSRAFHAVAAFMMLNATAVFGPHFWIPVVICYAMVLWWSRR